MFTILKRICLILILLLIFLTGLYNLSPLIGFPAFIQRPLRSLFYFFYWSSELKISMWILMLLLPILYVLLSLRTIPRKQQYVIRGKEGDSVIAETAIVKSLISAIRTIPTVVKVKPVIRNERSGLQVRLETYIKLEQFVPNICERVRRRAKSTLTEVLGIDRITRIDVRIEEVKLPHPPLAEKIKQPVKAKPAKPVKAASPVPSPPRLEKPFSPIPKKKPSMEKPSVSSSPSSPFTKKPFPPAGKPGDSPKGPSPFQSGEKKGE